jgi:3-hydroxyisobutyrate dehydrogenase-like beta-hydroxyacid dehydrogenase
MAARVQTPGRNAMTTDRGSVALLGLGMMGSALGERLLDQGFVLTAWNRTSSKAQPLTQRGARCAATAREAVASNSIVILCLRDEPAAEDVLFGAGGIAKSLRPGSIVIDVSTVGIAPTKALAERLMTIAQAKWVDAPVSGGPSAARNGTLTIFCGGAVEDLARLAHLFDAISSRRTHMGGVGAGQAAKLCNQLIVSTTLIAITEAIALARSVGIDPAQLPQALAGGYADSAPLRIFGPRMASQMLEPRISEVATMRKDVLAVLKAASSASIRLPLMEATAAVYDEAMKKGLGSEDLAALARLGRHR